MYYDGSPPRGGVFDCLHIAAVTMCSSAAEESGENRALCDPGPKSRKKRSRVREERRRSRSLSTEQYDSGRVLGTRRVAINSSSSTRVGVCRATFLHRALSVTCRKGHNITRRALLESYDMSLWLGRSLA